jgi:hypothetical protein
VRLHTFFKKIFKSARRKAFTTLAEKPHLGGVLFWIRDTPFKKELFAGRSKGGGLMLGGTEAF